MGQDLQWLRWKHNHGRKATAQPTPGVKVPAGLQISLPPVRVAGGLVSLTLPPPCGAVSLANVFLKVAPTCLHSPGLGAGTAGGIGQPRFPHHLHTQPSLTHLRPSTRIRTPFPPACTGRCPALFLKSPPENTPPPILLTPAPSTLLWAAAAFPGPGMRTLQRSTLCSQTAFLLQVQESPRTAASQPGRSQILWFSCPVFLLPTWACRIVFPTMQA